MINNRLFCFRYFNPISEIRCKRLLVLSTLLCLVGQGKFLLWLLEVLWARNMGADRQFVFFNYTLDEPIWDLVYTLSGIFGIFVATSGSQILAYCTSALISVSILPTVQYLWIDYRWITNVKISDIIIQIPKPHTLLQWNMALTFVHFALILVIGGCLLKKFISIGAPWNTSKISIEGNLKQTMLFAGT